MSHCKMLKINRLWKTKIKARKNTFCKSNRKSSVRNEREKSEVVLHFKITLRSQTLKWYCIKSMRNLPKAPEDASLTFPVMSVISAAGLKFISRQRFEVSPRLGSWFRQPPPASSGFACAFGFKWDADPLVVYSIVRATVKARVKFVRPSVKAWGTPLWLWGLRGKPPAWCLSPCGCSSSGRRAWPCTCGCKHTRTHTKIRSDQLFGNRHLQREFGISIKCKSLLAHEFPKKKSRNSGVKKETRTKSSIYNNCLHVIFLGCRYVW